MDKSFNDKCGVFFFYKDTKQIKLNVKKTNNIIVNFTDRFQFNTRLNINNDTIDTIEKTKLLL